MTLGTSVDNVALPNAVVLANGELHLQSGYNFALAGNISGSGSLVVESDVTLSGANSYTMGTTIAPSTSVIADNNTALGMGPVNLGDGADISFTNNAPKPVLGSLHGGDSIDIGEGESFRTDYSEISLPDNATLTVNQTVDDYYNGRILGTNISLVKTGAAALTLGSDNYDIVHTTITAGQLIAGSPHALGSGDVILNGGTLGVADGVSFMNPISFGAAGGMLSGNGTFSNPITAGTNVVLSPGNSPGTLNFAAGLTLAGGGSLIFQVQSAGGAAGTGYDLLSVSGAVLDVTATNASSATKFTIYLTSLDITGAPGAVSDFSASNAYTWTVATSSSGITNFAADKFALDTTAFANSLGTGVFSLGQNGNDLVLTFSPIPEPSTYALLALGLGLVALPVLQPPAAELSKVEPALRAGF